MEKVAAQAGKIIGPSEKQSKSPGPVAGQQKSVATVIKKRKVVQFISHEWTENFGVAAEEEFSEDDDEESKSLKMAEKEKVVQISRRWKIDRNGEESELETNAPFESFADNFFTSGLLFGQAKDMAPSWYAEAARRLPIMADLILDRFPDQAAIYLDGEEFDRPGVTDRKIPPRGISLGELEQKG